MPNQPETATASDRAWRKLLVEGQEPLLRAHRFFRYLPRPPRCKLCHTPFGGVGGKLVGLFGFKPSRKNPNLCARCCEALPQGGAEVDIAVLFADVRGSTGELTPSRAPRMLCIAHRSRTALEEHRAMSMKLAEGFRPWRSAV